MRKRSSLAMLTANYLLAVDAYTYVPNFFKTDIPSWNGFWVVRFGQMINFGVEKRLIADKYAITSIAGKNPKFTEDMRVNLIEILRHGMVGTNSLAAAQTALDIMNAPGGKALGKIKYGKYVAPIAWYEKGEKVVNAQKKKSTFRKSVEKQTKTWYKLSASRAEAFVVNQYKMLF